MKRAELTKTFRHMMIEESPMVYVKIVQYFNPLSPHDALKHHFTSLKTDLIFLKPRVLIRKFPT